MAQDQRDGDTSRIAVSNEALAATEDTPHCRCSHPLHPDRKQKRRGVMMERHSCPQRRWYNFWHHPHVWMPAR